MSRLPLQGAKPDQVVVILKARELVRIMTAIGDKKTNHWHLQIAERWVVSNTTSTYARPEKPMGGHREDRKPTRYSERRGPETTRGRPPKKRVPHRGGPLRRASIRRAGHRLHEPDAGRATDPEPPGQGARAILGFDP